jgi:predicted metal-dependent hydrolase
MDTAQRELLDCDCLKALPELAVRAIAMFNAGDYYKQHDALEELWRETDRPVRALYQAILQVGVGYFQATRGNRRGALKMLKRGLEKLALLPDVCQGVDVQALRQDAAGVQMALKALSAEGVDLFDRTLFQPVKMV